MYFFNNIGNAFIPNTNGVSNAFNSISNSNYLTAVFNNNNNNNLIPNASSLLLILYHQESQTHF